MTLLELGPTPTQLHEQDEFRLPTDRETYLRLAVLALEQGWQHTISRVGQGALQVDAADYIMAAGSCANTLWYQVHRYDMPEKSPITIDLLPIFDTELSRHVDTFVQVYDREQRRLQPTLNVLSPNPQHYGRLLTQFVLPPEYLIDYRR